MIHLTNAWKSLWQKRNAENPETVVKLMDNIEIKGNKLTINVQDGVIPEVGINGVQITDVLEFVKGVYISLNNTYPCKENMDTINSIEDALVSQRNRTKDREKRGVEGKNKV